MSNDAKKQKKETGNKKPFRLPMTRRILTYELCKSIAAQYPNSKQLELADQAVCAKSRKMGWLRDFYPDIGVRVMDDAACIASAKNFKTRTEFHNGDRTAWQYAHDTGLLYELFPDKVVRKTSVTFEQCQQAVKELKQKGLTKVSDFDDYNGNMCKVARQNGWIPLLGFQNKKESFKLAGIRCSKYTIEHAYSVAHQYTRYTDFKAKEPDLYDWCCRHKIIRDFTWLERDKHLQYTDHELFNIAKQYVDYTEFIKNEESAYSAILKRQKKWIISFLQRNAIIKDGVVQDFIYVYEFPNTHVAYVGRTVNVKSRHAEHCRQDNDPIVKYAKSLNIPIPEPKILISNITIKHSGKMEDRMIRLYKNSGWTMLNAMPGGSMGSIGQGKWTLQKMQDAAHECEYWDELVRRYPTVYNKIRKMKIRNKFPWLKLKRVPNGTWQSLSEDEAYEYAKPWTSRTQFRENYPVLAKIALDNGWMVKWFPDDISTLPKAVAQYTTAGHLVKIHDNILYAAKAVGTTPEGIRRVIRHKGITSGGYVWAYAATPISNIIFPGENYFPRCTPRKTRPFKKKQKTKN